MEHLSNEKGRVTRDLNDVRRKRQDLANRLRRRCRACYEGYQSTCGGSHHREFAVEDVYLENEEQALAQRLDIIEDEMIDVDLSIENLRRRR